MPLSVLSLGWGVQSWTLAAMAALGEIPIPDLAVHADTTFEMSYTYDFARTWTPWLEARGVRVATIQPTANAAQILATTKNGTTYTHMPVFVRNEERTEFGRQYRQCTAMWKIKPIMGLLGRELRARGERKAPGAVQLWMGISIDEYTRMKQNREEWIENVYPLIDRRMSRADCLRWLEAHDLPSPGKSGCQQCPYYSQPRWRALKRASGENWEAAVAADHELRKSGKPFYLHSSCTPLDDAIRLPEESGQIPLFALPTSEDDQEGATCDSGHCFT